MKKRNGFLPARYTPTNKKEGNKWLVRKISHCKWKAKSRLT